jgi:hypothetical protein
MADDVSTRASDAVAESAVLRLERKRLLLEARNLREERRLARAGHVKDPTVLTILSRAAPGHVR